MALRFLSCVLLGAAAVFVLPMSGIAGGDSKKAVVDRVFGEMAAFSTADRAAFVASYVEDPTILDDVAPFAWSDAGRWYDAVRPLFRDVTMTPGPPGETLVDGRHAFVTVPFSINGHGAKGEAFKASGYWTGALVQVTNSWRIANAAITITK